MQKQTKKCFTNEPRCTIIGSKGFLIRKMEGEIYD